MPNLDEQEVRSYLLGSLSPERQTELQTLFDHDAELRDELLAIEEELFDQYVEGCLSADEQQRFETHLLSTADGQQRLQFAKLFCHYKTTHQAEEPATLTRAPAPNAPSFSASSPFFVSFHRNPAFAVLLTVVTGLLVTLVGWLLITKSPIPQPAAIQPAADTVVFTLAPGSLRSTGGITHLSAPPQNVHVKLELEIAKSDFKKYQTQLFRENQALESQAELKTEHKNNHYIVPVTVTGEMLRPGDYQLNLSGVLDSGQPAFIESYSFRITPDNPSESEQERRRIVR